MLVIKIDKFGPVKKRYLFAWSDKQKASRGFRIEERVALFANEKGVNLVRIGVVSVVRAATRL